jgi:glucose/arabinose dehydrogenase
VPSARRIAGVAVSLAAAATLSACASSSGDSPSGNWTGARPHISEQDPIQIGPGGGLPGGSGSGSGSGQPSPSPSSSSNKPKGDPAVVAKHLTAPVGLAILPDGTALVGERTTGRIVHVQPVANRPTPTVKTLSGLDTHGDGGLLDLAISPSYTDDNLIYAYITTSTDNRVVAFTLHGPVTPVLTGIPKGRTDNTGRIAFSADGALYVGTGDAGHPALAADPRSLAGKVLRVTDIGDAAPGNPSNTSPVFTRGHRTVPALCILTKTGQALDVEQPPGKPAAVNLLLPGSDYGWPSATPSSKPPAQQLPNGSTDPGGCAISEQTMYVTSLNGENLLAATLSGTGRNLAPSIFTVRLKNKYGRLRTVVAAPDGALWLTTSNKDGHGKPIADDERVIRLQFAGGGGNNPA